VSEVSRERPWQIMLTGPGLRVIDAETRQALEQILELFTEVGGFVVQTTAGNVIVTRDFPSDYTIQVDRLLDEIFKNNSAVTGIKCLGAENARTATLDDPHWSAHGKAYASIEEAAARGELTPEAAIVPTGASLYLREPHQLSCVMPAVVTMGSMRQAHGANVFCSPGV
jgi:hypothetical protein